MSDSTFSPELQRFIQQYIQSLEQLEILLLLKNSPGQEWTSQTVFEKIQSSERSAAHRLMEFTARGFLVATGGENPRYYYRPSSPELEKRMQELAAAYQSRRILLIETIFKSQFNPAQSFADAFKFKKNK